MIAPHTSNSICDRCLYLQDGWCCKHGVRRASKSPSCDQWYGYFKADLKKMKQDEAKGETNEAEEEKLLPCPFCGADGMITELKEGGFRAFCWECLSASGAYSTKADAIAAWNRRAK